MAKIARLIKRMKSRLQSPVYGYEHWQNLGTVCYLPGGNTGQVHQCLQDGPETCILYDLRCMP